MKITNKILKVVFLSAAVLASAQAAERIVIKGSDTLGAKLVPQLAEEFKAQMEKKGVEVTFEIAAEGSSSGVTAMIDGTADLAMSSREIRDSEYAEGESKGVNMRKITVAMDGIAVIVNARNPIADMAPEDVEAIFTGDVSNWSAVGGQPGDISVYTRNTSSGTYATFSKLAMSGRDYGEDTQKMQGNEQIASEVANNPNGIGYVGLAYIDKPGLKVVTINGHKPTVKEINERSYPYARPLYYIFDGNKQLSDISNLFIGFALSPQGQAVVNQVHFVPLY